MKSLIIVVSLFALFFSAAGYLRVRQPETFSKLQNVLVDPLGLSKNNTSEKIDTAKSTLAQEEVKIVPVDSNGNPIVGLATYEDYSPDKIARASTAPVVLFFHASWCPSCISTDRILKKKVSTLPLGTTILRVDYDSEIDLKAKYNITYQHTFVQVNASGDELARWSGGGLDSINANLVQ